MLDKVSRMLGLSGGFRRIDDAAARIGVIDVGSNSVRMVVFDGANRSPAVFFNEKVFCGLGAELSDTGELSRKGRVRAIAALRRFKALADGMENLSVLDAVGTAAIRDASDGLDFVSEVEARCGLGLRVASGADEARLAAQGVLVGEPGADGVVADIGGASMELIELSNGVIGDGVTTPLGPLRLDMKQGDVDTRIDSILEAATTTQNGGRRFAPDRTLFIVGGSWRALIKAHMEAHNYPLRVLHGFSLSAKEAREMSEWGAQLPIEHLRKLMGASERRAAVTPGSARVLARLIRAVRPKGVTLSAFGLREGVLWEHLPDALRAEDPLLQPCVRIERRNARRPGFGAELWAWLAPTLPDLSEAEQRLAQAACLLCDANWETHPDYRSRSNFELITRNNFGGISHQGRLFIGVALMHRYKEGGRMVASEPATALLPRGPMRTARALGRGMRLGAMLGAASSEVLSLCPLSRGADRLTLRLTRRAVALEGEELERRLRAFASALDLDDVEILSES